tara:strand:- start:196 stop:927 length:732 start_codon:yes stop_codon:yes gene_type:complete
MIFLFLILENKNNYKNGDDIEFAVRILPKNALIKNIKILHIILSLIIFLLLFSLFKNIGHPKFLDTAKSSKTEKDLRVLGHYPYQEAEYENLIEIQPNILVHKGMYKSLKEMQEDAEKDGIYLVFLSGYRSIKLQKQIFYSLKSIRNQVASERARVSAPPGYSEHSTGFAIDIGDAYERETDFEESFENTSAFKWLKNNAAKYHFRLSFDKKHTSVDYEPWHWRYEGSIEALEIFESANRETF